jgi:hypothetical protein
MFGLPIDLRRRLLRPYPFLAACYKTELVIVEVLAPRWDLGFAALRMSEVGLRRPAPQWPSLLGRWRRCYARYSWVFPLVRDPQVPWRRLLSFLPLWVLLGQHTVGTNVGKTGISSR